MTVDEVRYDEHGPVAVVTIDRQHRRNAIDGRTAQALVDAPEAAAIGLLTQVVDAPLDAAVELGRTLAAFPQETMLSDRASVYAGFGRTREDALAEEMRLGLAVLTVGRAGAQRFAAGEGR